MSCVKCRILEEEIVWLKSSLRLGISMLDMYAEKTGIDVPAKETIEEMLAPHLGLKEEWTQHKISESDC